MRHGYRRIAIPPYSLLELSQGCTPGRIDSRCRGHILWHDIHRARHLTLMSYPNNFNRHHVAIFAEKPAYFSRPRIPVWALPALARWSVEEPY